MIKDKLEEIKVLLGGENKEISEYEEKDSELENLIKPIMDSMKNSGGPMPGGMPGEMPGGMPDFETTTDEGPSIAEID